jgi:hypothetical protein
MTGCDFTEQDATAGDVYFHEGQTLASTWKVYRCPKNGRSAVIMRSRTVDRL